MPQTGPEPTSGPRGGGVRNPQGFLFELTGGSPCLDLVNTLDERLRTAPRDNLASYRDLADWGEQVGLVTASEATGLRRAAERDPAAAERAVERARAVRETLYSLLTPVARGEEPPPAALAAFNRELGRALARLEVAPVASAFEVRVAGAADDLERPLPLVLRSALELLISPDRARLRRCAAETCAWLFLDRSKNASRRWCDMSVCGNRAKARRHYRRRRS